jgi:membrane-bound inhibitor of C-type lysozyme
MSTTTASSHPLRASAVAAAAAALLCVSCAMPQSQSELEATKNTFSCQSGSERIVIRFDVDEARLLMPDGNRVSLYQIPAASGVRYANSDMELRGKGTDLQLVRNGAAIPLADCQPYQPPK